MRFCMGMGDIWLVGVMKGAQSIRLVLCTVYIASVLSIHLYLPVSTVKTVVTARSSHIPRRAFLVLPHRLFARHHTRWALQRWLDLASHLPTTQENSYTIQQISK